MNFPEKIHWIFLPNYLTKFRMYSSTSPIIQAFPINLLQKEGIIKVDHLYIQSITVQKKKDKLYERL